MGMFRSNLLRWLAVLVAVVAGLTVVAVARSVGPFRNWPRPATPTPPEQVARPLDNPAAVLDRAKPIYEGPLGEFLVIPRHGAASPTCPKPYRPARDYKSSELYSPIFGDLE